MRLPPLLIRPGFGVIAVVGAVGLMLAWGAPVEAAEVAEAGADPAPPWGQAFMEAFFAKFRDPWVFFGFARPGLLHDAVRLAVDLERASRGEPCPGRVLVFFIGRRHDAVRLRGAHHRSGHHAWPIAWDFDLFAESAIDLQEQEAKWPAWVSGGESGLVGGRFRGCLTLPGKESSTDGLIDERAARLAAKRAWFCWAKGLVADHASGAAIRARGSDLRGSGRTFRAGLIDESRCGGEICPYLGSWGS